MMVRSLVLCIHIFGMLVLFGGLGLEWLSFRNLRRSTTHAQAHPWVSVFAELPRVIGIAVGLILVSGIHLAVREGAYDSGWVRVSFGAMVLMAILGGPVVRSRMRAIRQADDDERDRNAGALRRHASHPLLRASLFVRMAIGLAIIYLMVGKPGLGGSLLLIVVALVLGTATSLLQRRDQSSALGG
jgi:uncharacterized membrane protein